MILLVFVMHMHTIVRISTTMFALLKYSNTVPCKRNLFMSPYVPFAKGVCIPPYIHVAMVVARDTILAVMMIDDGHDNNDGNGDMVMLMINTSTSHQSNPWTPIP